MFGGLKWVAFGDDLHALVNKDVYVHVTESTDDPSKK